MRIGVMLSALFISAVPVHSQIILRAFVAKDGAVHVVESGGATKSIPLEPKQVGSDHLRIAPDRHTVGWSVLIDNCCTSYPVPVTVNVYRDGKKVSISPDGLMVWKWHFVGRGERVAVLYGPAHGNAVGANLYDTRNGKLLASCNAPCNVPRWANGWQVDLAKAPQPQPIN
jgi:hypothetical protein